jgi:hypothetical protein
MQTVAGVGWRRSSYSGGSGSNQCIDVRDLPGVIAVRDSKNPDGPKLVLSPTAWRSFTTDLRARRYGTI